MKAQTVYEGVSIQDYLAGEQQTEIRHEFINGTIHAMGGASAAHNLECTLPLAEVYHGVEL